MEILSQKDGSQNQNLISMLGIVKHFGAVQALKGVDLFIEQGEIHAIVGENGAGKSTLMNILYGIHKPDEGKIIIGGERKSFKSPKDAIKNGIGMVHQHFTLIPAFTIEENIILGCEFLKKLFFLDKRRAKDEILKFAHTLGFNINPDTLVKNLSVGEQQRVEIIKALFRGAKILVLDEPTAVLTPQESKILFTMLKNLKQNGYTIILITHKLEEVRDVSERLTVLRDGCVVGTRKTADTTLQEIARMMVGRDILFSINKNISQLANIENKKSVLEVKNLTTYSNDGSPILKNISFTVQRGEIFGVAGVDGNGQKNLIEVLTGFNQNFSGEIILRGVSLRRKNCRQMLEMGVSHIPDDRLKNGLIPKMNLQENLLLGKYWENEFGFFIFFNKQKIKKIAVDLIKDFDIRPRDPNLRIEQFSGGNQQKIIVSRELTRKASLILATQPTRGLDIGAIEFIHNSLITKQKEGSAILLISNELSEIFSLSDRISVMFKGSLTPQVQTKSLDEDKIGILMLGGKPP